MPTKEYDMALLHRQPHVLTDRRTVAFYEGKCVLVTGGGGSIGSELCRQIAACHPQKLVILDIYENNAYWLEQALHRMYGDTVEICVEIASVRDERRLEQVFAMHTPQVVFHAAAHKHVPLMEKNPTEAIKNNVFGTYHTANMAEKYGVEKFILISTDKAIHPTSIMGASKRLCEWVVGCRLGDCVGDTVFASVRFGNVLGSSGSVVPLFQEQIDQGGPVTITDKRATRYFMTVSEAVQLVMQAGVMATSGELFVLDMGKPTCVLALAEDMIRLAGYEPYRDIDIVEVGLRPGEKLYEEILTDTQTLTKTLNSLIFIEHETQPSREEVEEKLSVLQKAVVVAESIPQPPCGYMQNVMKDLVPTYMEPARVNG